MRENSKQTTMKMKKNCTCTSALDEKVKGAAFGFVVARVGAAGGRVE